jgi:hypothetical protein
VQPGLDLVVAQERPALALSLPPTGEEGIRGGRWQSVGYGRIGNRTTVVAGRVPPSDVLVRLRVPVEEAV